MAEHLAPMFLLLFDLWTATLISVHGDVSPHCANPNFLSPLYSQPLKYKDHSLKKSNIHEI